MMNLKRLTFDGVNDLYLHPLYGARTLANISELDALRRVKKPVARPAHRHVEVSAEMCMRNERCIDDNGCSEGLW